MSEAGCSAEQIATTLRVLKGTRSSGAIRQARYRASQSLRHGDVTTVTRDVTSPSPPPQKERFPPAPPSKEKPPSPPTPLFADAQSETRMRANASFARFWLVWPNKVQKLYAEKCFAKVADQVDAIVDGVERYVREKPPDRPWLNPSTFLNQHRWKDTPAPPPTGVKPNGKGSIVEAGRRLTERLVAAERERELQAVDRLDDGDPAVRFLPQQRRERP
jgi:hypothetical protein